MAEPKAKFDESEMMATYQTVIDILCADVEIMTADECRENIVTMATLVKELCVEVQRLQGTKAEGRS